MMEYKTLTCKACGEEFRPHKEARYTAMKSEGFFGPLLYFDAIDCPHCGCQMILGERMQEVSNESEADKGPDADAPGR